MDLPLRWFFIGFVTGLANLDFQTVTVAGAAVVAVPLWWLLLLPLALLLFSAAVVKSYYIR